MDRKQFLSRSLKTAAGVVLAPALLNGRVLGAASGHLSSGSGEALAPLSFAQVPLPYAYDALEPSIDKLTMEIHYTKHHAAYVKNVNDAIRDEGVAATTEDEMLGTVSKYSAKARNNAGGAWNHNFFWQGMSPGKGTTPTGKVLDALNSSFGSLEKFKEVFADAAMKRFGSGWAWLVSNNGTLSIGSTPNQDNPLMDVNELKGTPLLALDVWEHAYYLKHQNKRAEYITNWWNVVNWDEVAKHLG